MATWIFLGLTYSKGATIGHSRAAILQAIDELGSIKLAAAAVGLSTRRTWYVVTIMNETFGDVVTVKRGRHSGGAVLTPKGQKLLRGFREIERDIYTLSAEKLAALEIAIGQDPDAPQNVPRSAQVIPPEKATIALPPGKASRER